MKPFTILSTFTTIIVLSLMAHANDTNQRDVQCRYRMNEQDTTKDIKILFNEETKIWFGAIELSDALSLNIESGDSNASGRLTLTVIQEEVGEIAQALSGPNTHVSLSTTVNRDKQLDIRCELIQSTRIQTCAAYVDQQINILNNQADN